MLEFFLLSCILHMLPIFLGVFFALAIQKLIAWREIPVRRKRSLWRGRGCLASARSFEASWLLWDMTEWLPAYKRVEASQGWGTGRSPPGSVSCLKAGSEVHWISRLLVCIWKLMKSICIVYWDSPMVIKKSCLIFYGNVHYRPTEL